jgi:hypothetical protein
LDVPAAVFASAGLVHVQFVVSRQLGPSLNLFKNFGVI